MTALNVESTTLRLVVGCGVAQPAFALAIAPAMAPSHTLASPAWLPLHLVWPQLHQPRQPTTPASAPEPKPMPVELRERMQQLRDSFAAAASQQRYTSAPQAEWFALPLAMRETVLATAGLGSETTRADLAASDWRGFAPPDQAAISYAVRTIKAHMQRCTALAQRSSGCAW
ncbi:hypothetical protein [Comamonas koreensis]|uniref:Uncharacterized protein n=1 Tax=Comamonas koreensis TaxID=160825 RepID=A0AAW4XSQ4_9BURK|nr:hypothetical protein [Comamonas koreensis]MCD2163829.1 hypothetical protein [Comamonas koreensis]